MTTKNPVPPNAPAELPLARGHVLLVGTGAIAVTSMPTWAVMMRNWYGVTLRACLTYSAARLVSAAALAATTGSEPVGPDWPTTGGAPHQELAAWSDLIIVAPATATFVAKCAAGMPDNLALSTVMSARCPVVIAPSIADGALARPSVQRNLQAIRDDGYVVLDTQAGISAHAGTESAGAPADFLTILRAAHAAVTSVHDGS